MKKAKMLWIIYLALVGVVALFFTLVINQGVGGMFSISDKQGKVENFNSYVFLDFSKIENQRKSKYDKTLAKYEEKRKKRVNYLNYKKQVVKLKEMISVLQNKAKTVKTLKKKIAASKKAVKALQKRVKKARGAAKKRLAKKLKTAKENLEEIQTKLRNVDIYIQEANTLAEKIRKQTNQLSLSVQDAILKERVRLEASIKKYEASSAAYEKELLAIKKFIDKVRIERILAKLAYKNAQANSGVPSEQFNIIPRTTILFLIMSQQIDKKIPASLKGVEIIDPSTMMDFDTFATTSIETLETQKSDAKKKLAKLLKKMKKEGSSAEIKEEIKKAKEDIAKIAESIQQKKALDIIVQTYTGTIDKVVTLFKQYAEEITKNVEFEGMPFSNFLTQGIYLGQYAKEFPVYGKIVKEQYSKRKMSLSGIHKIEERLFGSRSQITTTITRKVFGVGEILTSQLAQTALDEFYAGFTALNQNTQTQLEQATPAQQSGTSGGGGEAAADAGDPTLNEGGDAAQPAEGGETPAASEGSEGDSSALTIPEMKTVAPLFKEFASNYIAIKPFFTAGATVNVTAGVVKNVAKSLRNILSLFDKLKTKYPKIIKQTPTDTSEGGTGDTIDLNEKFNTAYGKLKEINKFIQSRMTTLTAKTSLGSTLKIIFIIIFAALGGGLVFITYKGSEENA